jgi:hypothetical protein
LRRLNSPLQEGDRQADSDPCLAFDIKRRRLVVVSSSAPKFLYAYEADEGKWTILRELDPPREEFPIRPRTFRRFEIAGMCYSQADDAFYWFAREGGDSGRAIVRLSPEGEVVDEQQIAALNDLRDSYNPRIQLVAAGDYLVLIVPPERRPSRRDDLPAKVYVVNPENGDVLYSGDQHEPMAIEDQQRLLASKVATTGEGHLAEPLSEALGPDAYEAVVEATEPVRNPDNGHYYQFLSGPQGVTWEKAKEIAAARRHLGMPGYLATITSEQEEKFLLRHFGDRRRVWIGATDAEQEGIWKWATGPEAGTVFWRGDSDGTAVGYHNWLRSDRPRRPARFAPFRSQAEPSDSRDEENYAVWNLRSGRDESTGGWNDVGAQYTLNDVLVEYSPVDEPDRSDDNSQDD